MNYTFYKHAIGILSFGTILISQNMYKNDRIYLCYKQNSGYFECKLFKSFVEADRFFDNNINDAFCDSTILSISKYSPVLFDKYILKNRIQNMFCKIKIIKYYST